MFLYVAIRFSKVRKKLYVIAFAREYSDELRGALHLGVEPLQAV